MYVMIRIEVGIEELENKKKQGAVGWKPYGVCMFVLYRPKSIHQKLMNIFLHQTRHLGLSNHINYKVLD